MHQRLTALAVVLFISTSAGAAPFNYAEALQKSLYFYEAQQSGRLSPNNRVAWRGPACLADGQDIGRDLSGGWFDAGDHWTANLTMSFAAMTLAFSAIEHPEAYRQSGQMDELLEGLIHVNRYFAKCVLNPEAADPARDLEVAIGCGGREGVPDPAVHAMWAPAEVAHRMTNRPTFRLNRRAPGGDIPAAMAAAMAASSIVIRENGAALAGKRGYDGFDAAAFADQLLGLAEKLFVFGRANAGPVLSDKLPKEEQERVRKARNSALRSDGAVVEIGYRAGPFDKLFVAASFLQRAHLAKDPASGSRWLDIANEIYEKEYKAEYNNDWWKDYGAGNFGKLGAFNMMRLAPKEEKFHQELQLYCVSFTKYGQTPGGLLLRERFAHEYGSLRHANNAAMIALYYSDHVEAAPALKGNTWWKEGKSNAELKQLLAREARRQVDYALGDNPYGRSYLVGFGNRPFNEVHHRGAYGAWAGFHHFIKNKPEYRPDRNRHILYGALVAGPDHNDVFLCGKEQRPWLPMPDGKGHDFYYRFPNRSEAVLKKGYAWNAADQPYQDVMDSQFNEVALDYNAGITASFAFLVAHGQSQGGALPDEQFPPAEARDENNDLLTTDREFFVAARRLGAGTNSVEIEATLYNRSRWPSRVSEGLSFRYYFMLEEGVRASEVRGQLTSADGATLGPVVEHAGRLCSVEVSFKGIALFPGDRDRKHDLKTVRLRLEAPRWESGNDPSGEGLGGETALIPAMPVYEAGKLVGGKAP